MSCATITPSRSPRGPIYTENFTRKYPRSFFTPWFQRNRGIFILGCNSGGSPDSYFFAQTLYTSKDWRLLRRWRVILHKANKVLKPRLERERLHHPPRHSAIMRNAVLWHAPDHAMGGRQDELTGDVSASTRMAIASALHRDLRGIDFEKFGFAESVSSRLPP